MIALFIRHVLLYYCVYAHETVKNMNIDLLRNIDAEILVYIPPETELYVKLIENFNTEIYLHKETLEEELLCKIRDDNYHIKSCYTPKRRAIDIDINMLTNYLP